MKKLLLIVFAFITGFTAMAQQQSPDALIKVNTESYSFGKIKQGVPVTTYFEIANTTDKPLVVENAWGSCGCTTPEVPKEPIAPKSSTKLKVVYNAAGAGTFNKDVYIKLAGVDQPKNVKITGEVLDAAAYDAYVKENKGAAPAATKAAKAPAAAAKKAKLKS
ncbi:DUF1573 domain-containing protein [Paraflavisolibacter sp. H34]|uniref:DUF1573 domain-containing protein n=1 Tax=Huijunlia imazamoxiresistens TaxID=3127457 RepID=UPI003019A540